MKLGYALGFAQATSRLSAKERELIDFQQAALRFELCEAVGKSGFVPHGPCMNLGCPGQPAPPDAVREWVCREGADPPVCCSACGLPVDRRLRFEGFLPGCSVETRFYGPAETGQRLLAEKDTPFRLLRHDHLGLYHSAISHFGGLRQAFDYLGAVYGDAAQLDWRAQVGDFLGKLPDTVIAEVVGASVADIRRRRQQAGQPPFTRRRALEEKG